LIVDTNVVSRLEEIAKRGVDAERVGHRKVVHLVRWLTRRPDSVVLTAFGVIEGAGFHSGQISMAGLMSRSAAIPGVLRWGIDNPDRLAAGQPIPIEAFRSSADARVEEELEIVEELLPMAVLSNYVAALAIARAEQLPMQPLDRARWVHERLVASLRFIPLFGWLAGVLALCGRPDVSNRLRTSLFKLASRDLRRSCLSAAWDLGYLQLMSMFRTPQLRSVFGGLPPVLVTEEKRLPELAALITAQADDSEHFVAAENLDVRWRDRVGNMLAELAYERALATPEMPSWDTVRTAAEQLEAELGLEETPTLRLVAPTRTMEITTADVAAFLLCLRSAEAGAAIDGFGAAKADVLLGGIALIAWLARDNADARQREVVETWAALLVQLPEGAMELSSTNKAVVLARSLDQSDWVRFNAAVERMVIDEDRGFVLIWLWRIGRELLDDTAKARSTTVNALLDMLATRVLQQVNAGGR
jgi:hypothetical protein